MENIGLKLLSLALAVALWSAVSSDVTTEILVSVPVEFRNAPAGVRFAAEPSQVQLRVRGARRIVREAAPTEFSVPLDLSQLSGPGERTFPLRPENIDAPAALEVVEITPAQVKLTVKTAQEE